MAGRLFDARSLVDFVRRCRSRWPDFEVERVEQRRSKQVLYVRVSGVRVRLIVYRDGRLRAYSGESPGIAYAVKKVAERVLGLDREYES